MEDQLTVRQWLEKQEGVSFKDEGAFTHLIISKTVEKSLCLWKAEASLRMDEATLNGAKLGVAFVIYGGTRQAAESLLLDAIKADKEAQVTAASDRVTITITRSWRTPREWLERHGVGITPSSEGYARLTVSYQSVSVYYDYPDFLLDTATPRELVTVARTYQEGLDYAKRLAGADSLWKVVQE